MSRGAVVVTGAAGFVGSHLVEALLERGYRVTGVDRRTGDPENLRAVLGRPGFRLEVADLMKLSAADWPRLLDGAGAVVHLAARPGVRASWGPGVGPTFRDNVVAFARLLDALRRQPVNRLVWASSSSVYGDVPLPAREDGPTRPRSPYGLSKLAAEGLATLYAGEFGVPAVGLRFFTVYGPRQRADMALHRFIRAALSDRPVVLHAGGVPRRDFTYVGDTVEAVIRTLEASHLAPGTVLNVGSGKPVALADAVRCLGLILGRPVAVRYRPSPPGTPEETWADLSLVRQALAWAPRTPFEVGLAAQVTWLKDLVGGGAG